jgi:hypothetical protein
MSPSVIIPLAIIVVLAVFAVGIFLLVRSVQRVALAQSRSLAVARDRVRNATIGVTTDGNPASGQP